MRTFSKSTKLDNVLYDVRGPVVDEAARMEDEGERILKLNIALAEFFTEHLRCADYVRLANVAIGHSLSQAIAKRLLGH